MLPTKIKEAQDALKKSMSVDDEYGTELWPKSIGKKDHFYQTIVHLCSSLTFLDCTCHSHPPMSPPTLFCNILRYVPSDHLIWVDFVLVHYNILSYQAYMCNCVFIQNLLICRYLPHVQTVRCYLYEISILLFAAINYLFIYQRILYTIFLLLTYAPFTVFTHFPEELFIIRKANNSYHFQEYYW